MQTQSKKKYSMKDYLKFIIPSVVGVLLLMFPFKYQGATTILVALLADLVTGSIGDILPLIILLLITFTGIMTLVYKARKPKITEETEGSRFFDNLFRVSTFWTIVRIIGVIFAFLVFFKIGPEWIWSEDTGGLILNDLILGLFSIFLFAGFLLPFLTDFGLLEFVGALLTPVMRPIFKLPGRSSIDAIASWVGDGTIGITLTSKQYEEGYYTSKEAAIIATTFSAVSITFSLVILRQVGLEHLFGSYYLTILIAGVIAAIIVPRIPPLSRKKDTYYTGTSKDIGENVPSNYTNMEWGTYLAIERSKESGDPKRFIINGLKTVLDMWIGVLPVIMAFGTIALIIAETTPIFVWLGTPFIPILKLFNVPYAVEASQTMIVGFADMFLPAVIGASIPSEMTRFIVAATSVTQLIFMSETGAVILGSKIDVSPLELFVIFVERTLVTLPIIILAAYIIF